uniref:AP-1 complex subunit gamma n=1 Tax=Mucochytrium quahogii TaxID=96639 RepID=A0A7S2S4J2_9STRA|mmetsp:Transcript_17985/g.30597  ORF Transcript_17985/g.30597 Transcript_17985/m.30597 type:complete len:853 (+) Transcript_17985:386-2944(+)|eukprot:CAMPEP_0203752754 /NCGR_PEP_ID=MMETSP0098-20131031/6613_1 /ASSEMBLY_ACC=CAM_ASM_000208 /TAXON_ID=96639 /ORGANISM=" , Strain NY0313808BC1" /LENGTH=852 /DNA_ID=CAMNT_0050643049 /DNA_START=173 /DNA_END=2731 /DNA_ORIENTATION=-
MSIKLRELIRNVRACKTAAEERAVIAKESALIRSSFRDEDNTFRHRNVAKLLFIHMLGYPSHFGQMECLKLIASPRFLDKRIGYLGLALLVEETAEVLTLVTNSLSLDLSHRNHYVIGLALAALGNISNQEMLRDLSTVVLKLLANTNPYVRKKAALCGVQIARKVPDMVEDFVPVTMQLLQERNHAVVLTACTLLTDIANDHPSFIKKVRKAVPLLVKTLKNLVLSGYAPEYDINGIADPCLQVRILKLLGILGENHEGATELMNDILAQVATNTEGNRNSGNAILYECVRTIMKIESEDGLRVLAINILGRFLSNRDNNIRYVALHTLGSVVLVDRPAVQKHRETIVECLRDADISIRVRAIDLVFALIDGNSIESLAKELLNYLVVASPEQKKDLCSRLAESALRYSPSKEWHVHTLISVCSIAGREASNDIWQTLIALIGQPETEAIRPQIVHRLYAALSEDASQAGLVYSAVWTLGEFGQLVFQDVQKEDGDGTYDARSEEEVIDLLESTRKRHDTTNIAKGMILNAYVKLSVRFHESQQRIRDILKIYEHSTALELQSRSCEYSNLLSMNLDASLCEQLLVPMPVPTDEEMAERRVTAQASFENQNDEDFDDEDEDEDSDEDDEDDEDSDEDSEEEEQPRKSKSKKKAQQNTTNLLDLDDIFASGSPTQQSAQPSGNTGGNQMDLLAGIFGGDGGAAPAPAAAPAVPSSGGDDLLGMFGGSSTPAAETFPPLVAYNQNNVNVTMNFARGPESKQVVVTAVYSNTGGVEISNFVFQAAVPKFISLKMEPPSGDTLPPFGTGQVQQRINLVNSMQGSKDIIMKVKIAYTANGENVVQQATVSGFPQGL